MLRLSRFCLILLAAASLAAFLPELFWKAFDQKIRKPFLLYSPVAERFLYRSSDDFGQASFRDEEGRDYSRKEWETLLPFFYYRDLKKWGILPESVGGFPMDCDGIRAETQVVTVNPYYLANPQIDLYPLFESKSEFTDLEFPDEMFRIDDRMEFISSSTNRVIEEQSAAFTGKLEEEGFRFPARYIAGNPTTRKSFDEGYFVLDDGGMLFHVKKVEGEPFCVRTGLTPPGGILYMGVRENARKEFYGVMICGDGGAYLLSYSGYGLIKLPLEHYDPRNFKLRMITDPFYRTITYWDPDGDTIHCLATDRDYAVLREYDFPLEKSRLLAAESVFRLIFPFAIDTQDQKSNYVLFRFRFSGWSCLAGIAISLLIAAIAARVRSMALRRCLDDLVVVALTGPYGLLAVLLVGRMKNS